MKRSPTVAGQFYSGNARTLAADVIELSGPEAVRVEAIGAVCPHAGLIYSGGVAGAVYSRIKPPHTFILLGPNHTGRGADVAIMPEGTWTVPGGECRIDAKLAASIMERSALVSADDEAHRYEHSLEVQLPFILHHAPQSRIVPIAIMFASLEDLKALGHAVADAVRGAGYPVVIVASSDMSHFNTDAEARVQDRMAIDRMLALDPDGLYGTVRERRISMCGVLPATVMIAAANRLGARSAELVRYATSAETSGDYDRVVGYAGVLVT